jgi:hypothetical protein
MSGRILHTVPTSTQLSHFPSSMTTTTSIIDGSLDAISTAFEAWKSFPELVSEAGSSSLVNHDESKSESTSLSLLDDDSKKDEDDAYHFCPLPEPFSARNHWNLLSSNEKYDSSLQQIILRPPSSLEIPPPQPTSGVPDPRRRATNRPCCLFINYLGTRLPAPKLVAASSKLQHKETTSTPTSAPTMLPTIVTPDIRFFFRTSPKKAAPFPLVVPAHHMCPGKCPTHSSALNLKVPIHLTNLKLTGAVQVKKSASFKKQALPGEPVKSMARDHASERHRNKKRKGENILGI